jgi:hypothetical protein
MMSSELFQGLSFVEIIEKLQEDKRFSNQFEAFALRAAETGLDSPAGQRLLRYFARDANELAQLTAATGVIQMVLTVNRRETHDTTTPATPGIGTTGSTMACEAVGLPNEGLFGAASPSEAVESNPQTDEQESDEQEPDKQ